MANGWGHGGYGPPPAPGGYGPPPSGPWGQAPQPMVVHQAGPAMVVNPYGVAVPACRLCGGPTGVHSKISTAGWVVFFGLLLFCFPLCWLGLLMREHGRRCNTCLAMQGGMG